MAKNKKKMCIEHIKTTNDCRLSEQLSQVSLFSLHEEENVNEIENEEATSLSLSDAEDFIMRGEGEGEGEGEGRRGSTEEVTSTSLFDIENNNESSNVLSQDLFESQDYATPNDPVAAMDSDCSKENIPCLTPIKTTVSRIKRHRPGVLSNQPYEKVQSCFDESAALRKGSGSDELKISVETGSGCINYQLATVGEGICSDDLRTPLETASGRKTYVSKSALALRARVMTPRCMKNPYVYEDEELKEKLQRITRRSPACGLLGDYQSGLSRYRADFQELREIGRGNFSHVYKVLHRIDGCCYAVKRSAHKLQLESEKEEALLEVQALAALGPHKNIVGYHTAWFENHHLYIQMELCDYSLANALEKGVLKSDVDFLDAMYQIAHALEFIHCRGVVHLDIKPENIYVCGRTYKLGDFGRARLLNGVLQIEEGDARYIPHEIINGNYEHLDKADMFSLGATFYELVKRKQMPDSGRSLDRSKEIKIPLLPGFSVYFQKLLQALVDNNPIKRPSAKDLLKNPVFDKVRKLKDI